LPKNKGLGACRLPERGFRGTAVVPPSLAGIRVVVVDDDDGVREAVRDYLIDCGAEVISVRSAQAAMLILAESPPDVLISDVSMPEHDGFWLIRAVRNLPAERGGDVPAIAITGRIGLAEALLAAGFTEVRGKPPDMAELVQLVAGLAARC
jgi:CheY-like chemotaxis protein